MGKDKGERIAAAALALVGAPFRLHGRDPVTGVDCVGLVWCALTTAGVQADPPRGYSVRGCVSERQLGWASAAGLLPTGGIPRPGDILLVRPSPTQAHLMVVTQLALVHADAGLGRVACRPSTDWPVLYHFRYQTGA